EWMLDERFKSNASRAEFAHEIHPRVVEWAAGLTKAEIYALAQQHGSPSAYFATPGEVAALPHEHARQFFASVDHPVAGVATYPVHNVRMSETPVRLVEAAPTLGQHNREVYMEHLGLDAETLL